MTCKKDVSTFPTLSGCPADDELILFNNAVGGWSREGGETGYAWRTWAALKACLFPALEPYDFRVDGSSFISTGESSVIVTAFIGLNIDLFRGGIVQYTTDPDDGSIYYSWTKSTGQLILINGAAQLDEPIRIVPIR